MIKKSLNTFIKLCIIIGIAGALNTQLTQTTLAQTTLAQPKLSKQQIEQKRSDAQQQFASGQLEVALKTIEELIVASPADIRARFFRAQLLASLGRGKEVIDELKLIATLDLPPEDMKKAKKLIADIEKQNKRWNATINTKIGIGQTNNVNAWPEGGERTSGGTNFPLPDPINERFEAIKDTLTEASVGLKAQYSLNEKNDLKTLFGFFAKRLDGQDTVNIDATTFSAHLGIEKTFQNGFKTKAQILKTSINRVNNQDNDTVNTDIGITTIKLEISRKLTSGNTLGYIFSNAKSDHKATPTADLSDAKTDTHSIYLGGLVGEKTFLRGTLFSGKSTSDLDKSAIASNITKAKQRVDKSTNGISLVAVHVLPHSQRIVGTITRRVTKYDSQEVNTNVKRKDTSQILTLAYSIKGKEIWKPLGNTKLGLNASYSSTQSNQDSADIKARRYMFTITKKFSL